MLDSTLYAFAWRSGQVEFGNRVPAGAICVARGDAEDVRSAVSACARHAYDGVTLLVPGIPEADTDGAAGDALEAFIAQVGKRLAAADEEDAS